MDPFPDEKSETRNLGDCPETRAKLELGSRSLYVVPLHCTYQPPLPRRPRFQNALAHGATQPQPGVQEAGRRHAAPILSPDPAPDVIQPSANSDLRRRQRPIQGGPRGSPCF